MKTIVPELSRQEALELVAQQRKEYRLIGSQRHIPGLILFEYDTTTGELRQASVRREVEIGLNGAIGAKNRVDSKDLCLYVQAINKEVAMRKVMQLLRRNTIRKQLLNPQKNGK